MSRTLLAALALILSTHALADDDVCKNTTLVTNSGDAMTAEEFCDALAGHTGGIAVYSTQCYGGGIGDCCVKKGVKGFFGSGSQADELQHYGAYDVGVAGGLAPGANTGDVHNGGASNVDSDLSTPQSSGVPGTIPPAGPGAGQSHAIFFAGKPTSNGPGTTHEDGHNDSIEGNFGDDNTTTLMGDGSADGEDAATKDGLKGAIAAHQGQYLVIYLDDHGNRGVTVSDVTLDRNRPTAYDLDLGTLLFDQAMMQPDSNPLLFVTSETPLPDPFWVDVNGYRVMVDNSYVDEIELFGRTDYRAEIPFPHAYLEQDNIIMMYSRRAMTVDLTIDLEAQKPFDGYIEPPVEPVDAEVQLFDTQQGWLQFLVMMPDYVDFGQYVHVFDVAATCVNSSATRHMEMPVMGPMDVVPIEVCPGDEVLDVEWSYSLCTHDGACTGIAYDNTADRQPPVSVP